MMYILKVYAFIQSDIPEGVTAPNSSMSKWQIARLSKLLGQIIKLTFLHINPKSVFY